MPERPAPVVLLDLDGTLVDSRAAIVAGINGTLAELGAPERAPDVLYPFIGPPLHHTFATLLGLHPDDERLDAVVAGYRARYRALMVERTPVFAGIPEALDALVAAGCVLAIATSKAQPLAAELLDGLGLGGRMTAICGPVPPARDDKATTVGHALEATGGPARAVMVGDRHHDVEGARAHGLACVGVLWGIGDADELADAGAATLCAKPTDLADAALSLL